MKKIFFLIFGLISIYVQTNAQANLIYNYEVTTPEGQVFSLKDFKGKKIVIVVFPASKIPADAAMISKLDSFSIQYASKVAVIGIPTLEDGYNNDSASSLKTWYRGYTGNFIILSKGVNSRKASKNQDPLFAWLTNASLNGHFDQDIGGAGQMFFINESGEMYGVISASSSVNAKVFRRMLLN